MNRPGIRLAVFGLLIGLACAACKGKSTVDGTGGTSGAAGNGTGGASGSGGTTPQPFAGSVTNLDALIQKADLVFEGEVTSIEYANSMNNGTGGPDPDDADDSGAVPHTFVTYRIVEDFSGNAVGDTVTMRFIGGVDGTTGPDYDILELAQAPRFDMGDRDIVMMRGNTELACPLVDCADGRFRVLQSPREDRPYMFSELAQEVRLVEDSSTEAHLFMVGEHVIPELVAQTFAFPDGETAVLVFESTDETGEVDPVPKGPTRKHSTEPRPDGSLPLDQASEPANAPVAGYRLEPAQFRALIRKAIADHPEIVWGAYENASAATPFTIGSFADIAGPAADDDPRVPVMPREPYEEAEAGAVEQADLENDGSLDPGLVLDIQSRRQTLTGVIELPNEEDEDSAAEDMWTEPQR